MTYIKIGDIQFEANVSGTNDDRLWDNRESKSITLTMTYEDAKALFLDDVEWTIVYQENDYMDENGETVTPEPIVYNNSDYSVSGPITDNRDGTVTVKMGKPTAAEILSVLIGG